MSNEPIHLEPAAQLQVTLFKRSLPMQIRLQETIKAIGSTTGLTCLDIGLDQGVMSHYLRKRGGTWHTLVSSEVVADVCRKIVPDNVGVMTGDSLPFKKPVFDLVVISGVLERTLQDELFIEECHRVLKPDGRLVVHVPHFKTRTVINALRRMFRLTADRMGLARPGYTEVQLFTVLKNGFDVHSMRSYSRFFVEATGLLVQWFSKRRDTAASTEEQKRMARYYLFSSLFLKIADQLDMLIFFSKGHNLIAVAKRRAWRPRHTPILVDGRSISEAVLRKTAQ